MVHTIVHMRSELQVEMDLVLEQCKRTRGKESVIMCWHILYVGIRGLYSILGVNQAFAPEFFWIWFVPNRSGI